MKVLAVDDDHSILDVVEVILRTAGECDVVKCLSGEQALAAIDAARRPFDCFLLDIRMPGMSGIDLAGRIRAMDRYRDTPVVMLTALSDAAHIKEAFAAGADDYITKPFEPYEIEAKLFSAELHTTDQSRLRHQAARGADADGDLIGALSIGLDRMQLTDRAGTLVSPVVFENCVMQVHRTASSTLRIIAVEWLNVDDLEFFGRESAGPAISRIMSKALNRVLGAGSYIWCSQGDGVFVIADLERDRAKETEITFRLRDAVVAIAGVYLPHDGPRPELSFGHARPDAADTNGSAIEMVQNALRRTKAGYQ